MRSTKNAVSELEFWVLEVGRDGGDDARELGAGDPGKGWLVLVFAADLEEVEEVGGRGVDVYNVGWARCDWVWEGGDGEFVWSLEGVSWRSRSSFERYRDD